MWSDFIKDVVSFLVGEKSEDPGHGVEAAVGLIVYGATTLDEESRERSASLPSDETTRSAGETAGMIGHLPAGLPAIGACNG